MDIQQHAPLALLVISVHTQEQVLHSNVALDSFQDLAHLSVIVAILVIFATQQQQLKHIWRQTLVLVNHA